MYDNACDTTCNECGDTREVGDHQYVGEETVKPTCGTEGVMTYTCSVCGDDYTETIAVTGEHTYDNDCDSECNQCGATREVSEHVYDNACDTTCNICDAVREVSDHQYDNACDAGCNECGYERTPAEHVYDDKYDTDCNVCGETREVPEKPTAPERPTEPSKPEGDKGEVEENPKTDDTSHVDLWFTLMICSAVSLLFVLVKRNSILYTGKYCR